jgi:hypothetical protein
MSISLNPSLTSLRKGKHRARVFFGTWTPDIVFEATVLNGISDKATYIPVDTGTGDITDCLPGFTVRVFSSTGAIKGATNVRAYGTPVAGRLPIRETGGKDLDFFTGDIVRVYNMPYLGDKLPVDDASFAPDGLPYGTQGSAYRPNTVSGGHFIGYVDSGETFATVPMWGAGSENLDPDSTPGNVTHLWTLLTSTLAFQSGSVDSDADPVIEASVGYGIALHTVTDTDNSTSWSQYVCFQVYARNGSVPGFPLTSCTLNGEELAGWGAEVEVMGAVPRSALPDGQMCAVWVDETIAGLHQSVGGMYVGREHIKFIGFLSREENNVSYRRHRTRFSLQSPLARYASLPGWSKVLTRNASPTDWTGIAGLTVKLALFYLPKYYSFITELFDFVVNDNFLDQAFSQFFLNKMTADAQVRELADGQDARLVNLRTGELLLHTHPCYTPIGSRSSAFKLLTMTDADVLDNGTFSREHWKTLEQFELRAFQAGAVQNKVFFSRYPGATPGRGNQSHVVEKVIATDQVDANERCGRRAAKLNGAYGEYQTLVGVYEQGVEWTPTLRGSYDGLDFHFGYVNTLLVEDSNGRGIRLYDHLFYLSRISVTYNANGVSRVNPTLVTATHGGWGTTHIPPVSVLPPYTPPGDIPPPWFPPSPPGGRLPPWNGIDQVPTKLFVLGSEGADAAIARAWSSDALSLVYEDISTGLTGDGIWASADPYDYRARYVLTTDGLFHCPDIWNFTAFTLVADNDTIFGDPSYQGQKIEMSINRRGYIAISSGANAFCYSLNAGASWNRVGIGGAASFGTGPAGGSFMRFGVSANNGTTGRVYALVNAGSTNWQLYRSEDWGASWSSVGSAMNLASNYADLNVPYMRSDGSTLNINDASQELYVHGGSGHPANSGLLRQSADAGASFTTMYSVGSANAHTPSGSTGGRTLQTFTYNGAVVLEVTRQTGAGGDDSGVRTSDDSGTTAFAATSPLFNSGELQTSLNGYAAHSGAVVAWCRAAAGTNNNVIRWTIDLGTTWASVATPSFFSGNRHVAYCEWDLSDLVPPG